MGVLVPQFFHSDDYTSKSNSNLCKAVTFFWCKSHWCKPFFQVVTMSDAQKKGEYVRSESGFRNTITADGSSGFKAEKGKQT